VLSGAPLPIEVVRQQICSAIDIIVHLSRLRDRSRHVIEISEVIGLEEGEVVLRPLFRFQEEGEEAGQVKGELRATGHGLQDMSKLQMAGLLNEDDQLKGRGGDG